MTTTTQHTPDANSILMGSGGAPTAKFDQPGTTIGGRILSPPVGYQEREYDPRNPGGGTPKVYPKSGDPIMAVRVDVQTALRDPSDPEDTGTRRVYIEGKRLKDAVRDAVRAAGASGLEVGGELHVTYTGLGVAEAGMNAPKLYAARYVPAGNAVLMGTPEAAAPAPVVEQAAYSVPAGPQRPPSVPQSVWDQLPHEAKVATAAAADQPPF